ncbi:MAG TPA: hypothetical protein VL866_24405 [Pyrinomonadaceae bacterium]|nr:hypothetical protein [Pyrinomonadaceae bacterium]
MSRETLLKDDDGEVYSLDNLATQKWLDGHYSGLDDCCAYLEKKATQLFSQRQRDKAVELQNLADELKKELRPAMVKRAKEHEVEFPSKVKGTTA